MIQQIKTALMGEESQTEDPWTQDRNIADTDDTSHTPSVGEVDPFRPEPDFGSDPEEEPDMDQIFGILGNQRRRYVLAYLSRRTETVTMSDLAERIAAWECGKEPTQITSKERKRVYVSLYQCHLPKMADAAAIDYDKDRGKIASGEQFEQFVYYLRDDE